jgi:hypothetical protein
VGLQGFTQQMPSSRLHHLLHTFSRRSLQVFTLVNGLISKLHDKFCSCCFILQDMVVYESTFVGLQGLAAQHPAGSEVLAAAEAALVGLLGSFAGQLKEVYGDDVLYQVRRGDEEASCFTVPATYLPTLLVGLLCGVCAVCCASNMMMIVTR